MSPGSGSGSGSGVSFIMAPPKYIIEQPCVPTPAPLRRAAAWVRRDLHYYMIHKTSNRWYQAISITETYPTSTFSLHAPLTGFAAPAAACVVSNLRVRRVRKSFDPEVSQSIGQASSPGPGRSAFTATRTAAAPAVHFGISSRLQEEVQVQPAATTPLMLG
jgi:hypothetical protein